MTWIHFSVSPNSSKHKLLALPEWVQVKHDGTVLVDAEKADPVTLAEIIGYPVQYVEKALSTYQPYYSEVNAVIPEPILKEAKEETHWSSHSVKVSSHVLRLYPVPGFVIQSLPEWASVTADYGPGQWVVDVDMNHATPVVLSSIAGWTIHKAKSVIEEFTQGWTGDHLTYEEHLEYEAQEKIAQGQKIEEVKKKIEEVQKKNPYPHLHIKTPPPLPEWAVPVPGKPWMVKIDLSQATAEGLAEITGWSVPYAQQRLNYFLSHPGLTPVVGNPGLTPVPQGTPGYAQGGSGGAGGVSVHKNGSSFVVTGGGGGGGTGVGAGGGFTVKMPGGVPADFTFTQGDVVEFKADDTALEDFIKNKHGLTVPHSVTMDIPITEISPEAANLLFGNIQKAHPTPAEVEEDAWTTGPDPVDALSEATGSPVTLSDKAKASLSPDRQRIAQKALEAVQCNCKVKGKGNTYWKVSSDCPVHGSKEDVTIAVVNAVLDYLGVIP